MFFSESTILGDTGSVNFPAGSEESEWLRWHQWNFMFILNLRSIPSAQWAVNKELRACLGFPGLQPIWTIGYHWVTSCPGIALWNKNFPPKKRLSPISLINQVNSCSLTLRKWPLSSSLQIASPWTLQQITHVFLQWKQWEKYWAYTIKPQNPTNNETHLSVALAMCKETSVC